MKRTTLFIWLLMLTTAYAFAQQKTKIIYRDTINLRGYVYDEQGKPVEHLAIFSSQRSLELGWLLFALTDTSGYFEFHGVKFNDTLTVEKFSIYNDAAPIYNKGSRYIMIYLSHKVYDIDPQKPIQITSVRKYHKKTPSFEVVESNENVEPFLTFDVPPNFRLGTGRFEDFIKNNIVYPAAAINNNTQGLVKIAFKIERDGRVGGFKIINGIGDGCEQAVIDAIKHAPHWTPALHDGRVIKTEASISVQFKLTDN